ncbi:MAG: hypothetical protein ACHQPI_02680 [Thermoanaerobaculia bacterium]
MNGTLWAVIVGGGISFLGSVVGSVLLRWYERQQQAKSLAGAFYGEIAGVVYAFGKGENVEFIKSLAAAQGPVAFHIGFRKDYFVIYPACAKDVGLLKDPLPRMIVAFYTQCFSLLDNLEAMKSPDLTGMSAETREVTFNVMTEQFQKLGSEAKEICEFIQKTYGSGTAQATQKGDG